MKNIKHIIFDLGNVIIDLDIPATERLFHEYLGDAFEASFVKNEQAGIFEKYEVGALSEAEFIAAVQSIALKSITPTQIKTAWNTMLLGIKPARLQMLKRLQSKYQLYILSNTNKTHLDWVYADLAKTHGITDWDTRFFTKTYYSHLIHLRKPNTDIYEFVLKDAGIKANETLFIDDNQANVAGAQQVGIQTIWHPKGNEIIDIMEQF